MCLKPQGEIPAASVRGSLADRGELAACETAAVLAEGAVVQLAWGKRLLALCRPCLDDPLAVQGKLCRRIDKHLKEPFVFVAEPEVPPDNNAAERSLRPLVISRKISGGIRSNHGTGAKQNGPVLHLRYLASLGPKPPHLLPPTTHFPLTLNIYHSGASGRYRPRLASPLVDSNFRYCQEDCIVWCTVDWNMISNNTLASPSAITVRDFLHKRD